MSSHAESNASPGQESPAFDAEAERRARASQVVPNKPFPEADTAKEDESPPPGSGSGTP